MKAFFSLALVSVTLFSCSTNEEYKLEITPPFKNVQVAYQQLEVDPSQDKVIRLSNGSSISVPKNAFVDKNGNPVSGKVKLEYREFQSAADIIASGISMTYHDEKGEAKHLESGGMFEIKGSVNNEEVFIGKGKELGVSMASQIPGEYDFYYLEEEGKAKQNEAGLAFISNAFGQDQGSGKKVRWKKLTSNVDNPEVGKEEADENAPGFSLKFDTVKFPETQHLSGIQWKLAKEGMGRNPLTKEFAWVANEMWERMEISIPRNIVKLNKEVKHDSNRGWLFFKNFTEDTARVIVKNDGLKLFTFSGEQTTHIKDTSIYYIDDASIETKRIITANPGGKRVIWSTDGKKIMEIPENSLQTNPLFLNKGRQIFYTFFDDSFDQYIKVIDLEGNTIVKLLVTPVDQGKSVHSYGVDLDVSGDKMFFCALTKEGINVWDANGKLVKQLKDLPLSEVRDIEFNPADNVLGILFNYGVVKMWDWKNDKIMASTFLMDENWTLNFNNLLHPKEPIFVSGNSNGEIRVWNYRTNTVKNFKSPVSNSHPHFEGAYILSSNSNREYVIFNTDGQFLFSDRGYMQWSDDYESVITFHGETEATRRKNNKDFWEWRDKRGALIKDFHSFDSTIIYVQFKSTNEVITFTSSGLMTIWDRKGNIVKTFPIDPESSFVLKATEHYVYMVMTNRTIKVFNYNGDLVQNYGQVGWVVPVFPDERYFVMFDGTNVLFWEISADTLSPGTQMINLRNSKKSFSTYVRLGKSDLAKIEAYKTKVQEKLKVERERVQAEQKLVRSFQIQNFGIYNWDRFYKEENMITFKASFDFGNAINGYNEVTVFLIAGKDQNTVIKYPTRDWEKFSYDPAVPNRLVAVLPDDRIAIFDPKEFEKLNKEELKKAGKYTFKMKVLDKVESVNAFNEVLKKPA